MTSYKGRPSSIPTAKPFEAFFWITPEKKDETSVDFASATIDWHYPEDVSAITKEFRDIPQFCFPDLETIKIERTDKAKSEHFTFTLTDGDGARVYGICLRVFDSGVGKRYDVHRRPRHCLCFITKYPFFSMLRVALMCLHSMRLLSQESELDFLSAVYNKRVSLVGDLISIPADVTKGRYRDFQLFASAKGGSSHSDVPIAPLVEILGIERFLLILSAALCERRIIFIATDVEKLSTSVHAAAAMLYPFQWQHIFIPLLPSKLLSYAAAPVPYMIGVRRYLLPMLAKEAMEDVIIVDCDSGECTMHGNISVRNIIGDAGNARKQASESFDRVKAEFNKYLLSVNRSDNDTAAAVAANATNRDVVACMLADLKSALAKRPSGAMSSVQLSLIRLGRSAADTSRDRWSAEFEVTIRESLMLFFVSLFGDMHEMMRAPTSSTAHTRGVAKSGEAFGQGDWRAALDVHAFLQRRIQLGTSKDLLDLISDMMHSQLFEKFCEERLRRKNQNKSPAEDAELEIFDRICYELSNRQLQPTVNNVKNAMENIQKCDSAKVDDIAVEGSHEGASPKDVAGRDSYQAKRSGDNLEQFHQLTLKLTSNSTKDSTGDMEEWTNKICSDAWRSDNFERICRTIWLRLEDCKQFNWRHGYKGLLLLRSLLLLGPECMLSNSLDHIPLLQALTTYKSNSSSEVRQLISSKAKEVLTLVLDQGLLSLQRKFWAAHRLGGHKFYNLQQHLQEQMRRDIQASGNTSFHPQSPNQLPHFRDIHMGFKPPDSVLKCAVVSLPPSRPASISSGPAAQRTASSLPRRIQQQAVIADLLDFDFEVGQTVVDAPSAEQKPGNLDPWSTDFNGDRPSSSSSSVSESFAAPPAVNPFDVPASAFSSSGFNSFGDDIPAATGDGFDDGFGSNDPFASSSPKPSAVPPPVKPPKPAAKPSDAVSSSSTSNNSFSNDGFNTSFATSSDPFGTSSAPASVVKTKSSDGFGDSFALSDPFASSNVSKANISSTVVASAASGDGFDSFGSDPFASDNKTAVASFDDRIASSSADPFTPPAVSIPAKKEAVADAFSKDPFAQVTPAASPQKSRTDHSSGDGFGDSFGASDPFASATSQVPSKSSDGFGDGFAQDPFAAPAVKVAAKSVEKPVTSAVVAAADAFSKDPFAQVTPVSSPQKSRTDQKSGDGFGDGFAQDPFAAPSVKVAPKSVEKPVTSSAPTASVVKSSAGHSSGDGFGDSFGSSDPFASATSQVPSKSSDGFGDGFAQDPFATPAVKVTPKSVEKSVTSSVVKSSKPSAAASDPFAAPFSSSAISDLFGDTVKPSGNKPLVASKSSDGFSDSFPSADPFSKGPKTSDVFGKGDPFSSSSAATDPFGASFGAASSDPFAAQPVKKGFDPFASSSADTFASSRNDPFAAPAFGETSSMKAAAVDPFASVSVPSAKSSDPFGDAFGSVAPARTTVEDAFGSVAPARTTVDPYAYSSSAAAPFPVIRTQLPPGAPQPTYGAKKAADPFADINQSWMKKK